MKRTKTKASEQKSFISDRANPISKPSKKQVIWGLSINDVTMILMTMENGVRNFPKLREAIYERPLELCCGCNIKKRNLITEDKKNFEKKQG